MMLGIDLGSNTLRFALLDENFEILKSSESIVGSARGLKAGGKLAEDAKERILNALEKMSKIFDFSAPNVAVATEAFRMASNSDEFFKTVKSRFGLNFKIIDGINEAKFVRLAIENRLNKLEISHKNAVFIDLGGASTEISNAQNFKSFEFGIIRSLNQNDKIDEITANAVQFLQNLNPDKIILTSGVPTTMSALKFHQTYENYNPKLINGTKLNFKDFENFRQKIAEMDEKTAKIALGENRKDLIICGIILLESLLRNFANSEFIVIDDGLREGVCIAKMKNLI